MQCLRFVWVLQPYSCTCFICNVLDSIKDQLNSESSITENWKQMFELSKWSSSIKPRKHFCRGWGFGVVDLISYFIYVGGNTTMKILYSSIDTSFLHSLGKLNNDIIIFNPNTYYVTMNAIERYIVITDPLLKYWHVYYL